MLAEIREKKRGEKEAFTCNGRYEKKFLFLLRFAVATFPIFINSPEALDRAADFHASTCTGDATRIIVVVGTPSSSTKAESEKEELVAFTFPSFAAIFHPSSVLPSRKLAQPLATPSVPVAATTAAATSLRHLLSAAIFRIRYLRSQLQISRIPRTEVPLDRTLSDTTRLPFPTRSPLVSRRPTRPPSDLSFPLSLPLPPLSLPLCIYLALSPCPVVLHTSVSLDWRWSSTSLSR